MRIELLIWKNEMVICGSCGEEVRAPNQESCIGEYSNYRKVYVGDLEDQSFSVLCEACMELEEAAIAEGVEFTGVTNPENPEGDCGEVPPEMLQHIIGDQPEGEETP